jgi:hypothetical protein
LRAALFTGGLGSGDIFLNRRFSFSQEDCVLQFAALMDDTPPEGGRILLRTNGIVVLAGQTRGTANDQAAVQVGTGD